MNEKAPKIMMEVKNINLRFGGVVAIQGVSFDIHEGEIRARTITGIEAPMKELINELRFGT